MHDKICIEICIDDPSHATTVANAGADRVEMCSALDLGGLTPTSSSLRKSIEGGIPVAAMIRLRPGDFILDDEDIALMRDEIASHIDFGADGIVLGALTANGEVDGESLRSLVDACSGIPVTFHRAFDHCTDRIQGLERIIDAGCQRLLSSGGAKTAIEGVEELARIVEAAEGRIEVLAGGGVLPSHALELVRRSGVSWIHLSARQGSPSPDGAESSDGIRQEARLGRKDLDDSGQRTAPDPAVIRQLRAQLGREEG